MKRLTKSYESVAKATDAGTGIGAAAAIGNIDRGGDVIFPGAFSRAVCDAFVKDGFVGAGHDWAGAPIGIPLTADEQGRQLVCTYDYHGTAMAQEYRQVAIERQAQGKSVGLSIGFSIAPDGYKLFASGQALLDWAKQNGYDMKLFDVPGIKAWDGVCRAITKVSELYEFSQVNVPMNPSATLVQAKGYRWTGGDYEYFESTAPDAAYAAFSVVLWDFIDDISQALYGELTHEQRMAVVDAAIAEFTADSRAVIDAVMTALEDADEDDDTETMGFAAGMAQLKHALAKGFAQDAKPLRTHLDQSLADLAGLTKRLENYAEVKARDARSISSARLAQMKQLHEQLGQMIAKAEPASTPSEDDLDLRAKLLEFDLIANN